MTETTPKTGRSKQVRVPEHSVLALPYPQISAREALAFVQVAMSEMGPHWFLGNLATAGNLGLDGCLIVSPNSAWQFSYCQEGLHDYISGYLFSGGALSFQVVTMSPNLQPLTIEGSWLDSREVAEIVMAEPDLSDLSEHKTLWMALRATSDGNLFWEVYRDSHEVALRRRARIKYGLDARTGEILAETYERWDRGTKVKSRVRQRRQGADWKDTDEGSGHASN